MESQVSSAETDVRRLWRRFDGVERAIFIFIGFAVLYLAVQVVRAIFFL